MIEDEDLTSLVSSNRLSEVIIKPDRVSVFSTTSAKPKDIIEYSRAPLQTEEDERDDLDNEDEPVRVELTSDLRATDTFSSKAMNPMVDDNNSSYCEESYNAEMLSARK